MTRIEQIRARRIPYADPSDVKWLLERNKEMLEALKAVIAGGCYCWSSATEGHSTDCFMPKAEAAIAAMEKP